MLRGRLQFTEAASAGAEREARGGRAGHAAGGGGGSRAEAATRRGYPWGPRLTGRGKLGGGTWCLEQNHKEEKIFTFFTISTNTAHLIEEWSTLEGYTHTHTHTHTGHHSPPKYKWFINRYPSCRVCSPLLGRLPTEQGFRQSTFDLKVWTT